MLTRFVITPSPQGSKGSKSAYSVFLKVVANYSSFPPPSKRWYFVAIAMIGLAAVFALWPNRGVDVAAFILVLGVAVVMARQTLLVEAQVTELQQKLQDEASYHAFVDGAVEGFFRTTRDGRYLITNPALARIYGYDSPEQLRSELTDIANTLYLDQERREEFQNIINTNGAVQDFISQIRRRDGSVIWIAENARTVIDQEGRFLFYEGTVEDITPQRESEAAIRRALLETQEASRAKAAFLAAMSHELKTPLNAVIGFSDVMRQELFGSVGVPRYRSYIEDIYNNGRQLLALINDILDLTRFESHLIDLDEQTVSVADIALSARDAVLDGKSKAPSVVIDIPSDFPALRADSRRLHQILVHLLSNAVKFTPAEGLVRVSAVCDVDGAINIRVQDNGIGMEPERIRQALEPFKQLDNRLARRFDGAGLGLPLARALCNLHDAKLAIQSASGTGTIASVCFPPGRTIEEIWAGCA